MGSTARKLFISTNETCHGDSMMSHSDGDSGSSRSRAGGSGTSRSPPGGSGTLRSRAGDSATCRSRAGGSGASRLSAGQYYLYYCLHLVIACMY